MIPILFASTATQFNNNGIGRLSDVVSCVVTEERNGVYILDMKYPITGVFYSDIEVDAIILAKPFDGGADQPFRINRISRPLDGIVTINAEHISYILNKTVAMPFEADTCQEALENLKTYSASPCPFTFITDKSVTAHMKVEEPKAIRGLLGGESGSILDTYGKGDYEFDHFRVILHTNRGMDNGVTLRYGKNIVELNNVADMSNTYTAIVPFWSSEDDILTLPEKMVQSTHTGAYANMLVKVVDLSSEWEDKPTVAQLRTRAQQYIESNEGWTLKQNVTVSFVNLLDTEEYKDIVALERVRMCDTITIIVTPLGVNVKAQVVKTIYDTLNERYNEIEIGESRPSLKTVIEEQVMEPVVKETSTRMQKAIKYATDLITGVKGGHLIINTDENGTPNELLIMNTDDKNTATQVLRINMNGIGFGKSYMGPFTTAWTLDGHFVANYIDTGTLNADLIRTGILRALNNSRNFWNMLTGEFHLRSDNASTGIDYQNGVLNINASNIRSGTLDASVANITNINASNIKSGSMSANYISGGTIDASKVNVTNINASNIKTGQLSANLIKTGQLNSQNGLTSFDLNNATIVCRSSDGLRVTTLGEGTLKASASGWPDIQVHVNNTILNELQVRGPRFQVDCDSLFQGRIYTNPGVDISSGGSISATWTVSAGANVVSSNGDVIAQNGNVRAAQSMYAQSFIQQSDRNRKRNIVDLALEKAKDFIMRLMPKSFRYKTSEEYHHGFVAQDVKEAMNGDEWSVYTEFTDAEGQTCGIGYMEIIADLVAVVQDQERRIAALEGRT